jgi:Reverse transcriptase (RNA-dependent DNA polymerase)
MIKIDFEKVFDSVNWNFLLEVLQARGFREKWRKWIYNLLESGQTNILINDKPTSYFKCQKGLRQGDPLSPFLFNLVADTLSKILKSAQQGSFIEGLSNFNGLNITHL